VAAGEGAGRDGAEILVSLSPPQNPKIGDVWVDSFTAERFIYTGDKNVKSGEAFEGWVLWEERNKELRKQGVDVGP
jgi:hypothetical protein